MRAERTRWRKLRTTWQAEPYAPPGRLNLAHRQGKLITEPFNFLPQASLPDQNLDFDGTVYVGPIAGATLAREQSGAC